MRNEAIGTGDVTVLPELAARIMRDTGGSTTTSNITVNVNVAVPANWNRTTGGPQGSRTNFHRAVNDAVRREIAKGTGG